jgi:hypothetical protein
MTYDQKCLDLAILFLSDNPDIDTPHNRDELAQAIQRAIEEWIENERESYDA